MKPSVMKKNGPYYRNKSAISISEFLSVTGTPSFRKFLHGGKAEGQIAKIPKFGPNLEDFLAFRRFSHTLLQLAFGFLKCLEKKGLVTRRDDESIGENSR